mmetsp:Transcript_29866/g.46830  ORF Transcript_29866/g.46830 Transcript_29866/m.46830 type:complete len:90 (+) Transcript_29866:53-322(+)
MRGRLIGFVGDRDIYGGTPEAAAFGTYHAVKLHFSKENGEHQWWMAEMVGIVIDTALCGTADNGNALEVEEFGWVEEFDRAGEDSQEVE